MTVSANLLRQRSKTGVVVALPFLGAIAGCGGSNVITESERTLTLNFANCSTATTKVLWVAYQDGTTGPWTRSVGDGDTYSFVVKSAKGGIAFVATIENTQNVFVQFGSFDDLQAGVARTCVATQPTTKSLTGTVAHVAPDQQAYVSLGGSSTLVSGNTATFVLPRVKDGTFDLVAYAASSGGVGTNDRLVFRRGINVTSIPNGGAIGGAVDFTGPESSSPLVSQITVANVVGGEAVFHSMYYGLGPACDLAPFYFEGAQSVFSARGVPANRRQTGEVHYLSVGALNGSSSRFAYESFALLGTRTVTLPPPLPEVTPATLAGPYKRLRFQYEQPSDLDGVAEVRYSNNRRIIRIFATAGYRGGGSVALEMPDLSTLQGWDNAWVPASSAVVTWAVVGYAGLRQPFGDQSDPCQLPGRSVQSSRSGQTP